MNFEGDMSYYNKVKEYYNFDSQNFEKRYWDNQTLQKIRQSFRDVSNRFPQESLLEIGYGPGIDMIYFAEKNQDKKVFGIDISDGMYEWASKQIQDKKISNVKLDVGSVEDISDKFEGEKFDHIIVYFGALNTVENIDQIQDYLKKCLTENGTMVLTFVNKWYLLAILKPLLKLKVNHSLRRLRKVWGGYSPSNYLASKCYSSRDVKLYFDKFDLISKRGYSILFPAWYENHINIKYPKFCSLLWKLDSLLQYTPFWNLGEYSLYVFKHRN